MPKITVISDETRTVEGAIAGDRILVDPKVLPDALGWALKPEGLCRDDTCVPVRDHASLFDGEQLDLAEVARALGRPSVADAEARLVVVALPSEQRRQALDDLVAPTFTLDDLDGNPHELDEWRGKKKVLVAFASWCGCRYDLPGWQALHDELQGQGFNIIAAALDESPDDVRPWTEGVTMPVLIDPDHVLTEMYAISNVPTVIWIDEDNNIVRPNGTAFSNDMFKEFTGVEAGPHLDMVRRWVNTGEVPISPEDARDAVGDLSDDELLARLHFRLAVHARRQGDDATARRHFDEAGRLAPDDFTVRRAALPLTGGDPFGDEFFAFYGEWQAAGSPYHGLRAVEAS